MNGYLRKMAIRLTQYVVAVLWQILYNMEMSSEWNENCTSLGIFVLDATTILLIFVDVSR